jgi:hypothetical protein
MAARFALRLLTVVVLFASAGGASSTGAVAPSAFAAQTTEQGSLDLAALTLRPGDLAGSGWTHDGAFMESPRGLADGFAAYWGHGTSPADVQQRLAAIGWKRMYIGELSLSGSGSVPEQRVRSYVTQYANADGAAAGFAYLEDEHLVASASDIPGTRTFGEQSEITKDEGTSAVDGRAFHSLDLTFRAGALVAGVTLIVYPDATKTEPEIATVEAMAAVLEQRLRSSSVDGGGLGISVLRFDDGADAVTTYEDAYYRFAGVDVPITGESRAAAASRTTSYGTATDVYQLWQGVSVDDSTGMLYGVTLLRFADEATAHDWLTALPETLAANPFYGSLQPLNDVGEAEFDAPAVAMRYVAGGGSPDLPRSALVAVQIGSLVLRVHLVPQGRRSDVPLAPLLALARQGIDCVNGSCANLEQMPGDTRALPTTGTPTA